MTQEERNTVYVQHVDLHINIAIEANQGDSFLTAIAKIFEAMNKKHKHETTKEKPSQEATK